MSRYPVELEEYWETGDEHLRIRPIRPSDAAQHDAFFHRLSPEDIRSRFFASVRDLTPEQLRKFTRLDYDRDMAFIAVREVTGETVGVARLARMENPQVAEFAVALQHDVQGKGLAAHLMQRLLEWAPQHGLRQIVGEILSDNAPMLDLARHLGFALNHQADDPQIIEAKLCLDPPKPGVAASVQG